MAQKGAQMEHEKFCCSICLDLLKDPVTTPCGHSYCMNCIEGYWDLDAEKRSYSCPQCRQAFTPRPVLGKNTMLADLVEELKKTGLQAAPHPHCYAGPEDVACDVCTGRKLKASNSCLVCVASYCETHLQPHFESPPLRKHKLVEPSKMLQENLCPLHNEVIKIFCRTDQQFICYLCSVDEHKGHDAVSAAAERAEKQSELEVNRLHIQQRVQTREEDLKQLQKQVKTINRSTDKAVEDSEATFTQLIRLMERRRSEVKQQLRSQQETEVSQVKELQEKLEKEIAELKRRDAELMKLSHTEDHNQFLQSYSTLPALSETRSSIKIRPLRYFRGVTAAVSKLGAQLQDVMRDKWPNISLTLTQPAQPETRADFLEYSRRLTLDPNTAHTQLKLYDGNRKVKDTWWPQSYPDHPGRFTHCYQVLSRESLTGRCYWEVEWSGGFIGLLDVAVAYKSISRAGDLDKCGFGFNDKSWKLNCEKDSFSFHHNKVKTPVSGPWSFRLGVYLDHGAGILSFYSVSETMTLLHRVQTRFTQPLYAGLSLFRTTVELCEMKEAEVAEGTAA